MRSILIFTILTFAIWQLISCIPSSEPIREDDCPFRVLNDVTDSVKIIEGYDHIITGILEYVPHLTIEDSSRLVNYREIFRKENTHITKDDNLINRIELVNILCGLWELAKEDPIAKQKLLEHTNKRIHQLMEQMGSKTHLTKKSKGAKSSPVEEMTTEIIKVTISMPPYLINSITYNGTKEATIIDNNEILCEFNIPEGVHELQVLLANDSLITIPNQLYNSDNKILTL